jgi:hypothetical protein
MSIIFVAHELRLFAVRNFLHDLCKTVGDRQAPYVSLLQVAHTPDDYMTENQLRKPTQLEAIKNAHEETRVLVYLSH